MDIMTQVPVGAKVLTNNYITSITYNNNKFLSYTNNDLSNNDGYNITSTCWW